MLKTIAAFLALLALCSAAVANPYNFFTRVWVNSATSGTGTLTISTALAGYLTPAQASVADQTIVTYVIIDGNNFEVGHGTYTVSGTTLSRDTVLVSLISGSAGTTKVTASGSETVMLTPAQQDLTGSAASLLAPSATHGLLGGM